MSAKLRVVTSGHLTKMAVIPSHPLYSRTSCYTQTSWLCVLQIQSYCRPKFYIGGIGIYYLDLFLWTWAWPDDIYELDPYSLDIYTGCANMNFVRQGFRKLSSDRQIHTDRQTDKQPDRGFRNYKTRRMKVSKSLRTVHVSIKHVIFLLLKLL